MVFVSIPDKKPGKAVSRIVPPFYLLAFLPSSQRQVQARFRPSGRAFLLPVRQILSIFVISDLTLLLSYAAILPQLQILGLLVLLWRRKSYGKLSIR